MVSNCFLYLSALGTNPAGLTSFSSSIRCPTTLLSPSFCSLIPLITFCTDSRVYACVLALSSWTLRSRYSSSIRSLSLFSCASFARL